MERMQRRRVRRGVRVVSGGVAGEERRLAERMEMRRVVWRRGFEAGKRGVDVVVFWVEGEPGRSRLRRALIRDVTGGWRAGVSKEMWRRIVRMRGMVFVKAGIRAG